MRDPEEAADAALARLLEECAAGGALQAEVFLKSSWTARCTIGTRGVEVLGRGIENGVALRCWYEGGGEGFVHSDGWPACAEGLAGTASASARRRRGRAVPRLPAARRRGPGDEGSARISASSAGTDTGDTTSKLQELGAAVLSRFARPGDGGARLQGGWIESCVIRTRIRNSLGADVDFLSHVAAASVTTIGSRAIPGASPLATTWFSIERAGIADLDPIVLADRAIRRTAISWGDGSVAAGRMPVLLGPCAAAVWLRSLVPFFVAGRAGISTGAASRMPGEPGPHAAFEIVDAPPPPGIDGEGREVGCRRLAHGTSLEAGFVDSQDAAPGPMRRDSYRDRPAPGPMLLRVAAAGASLEDLLREAGSGFYVTALAPLTAPGASCFVGEARGARVTGGRVGEPVARTLLYLPFPDALARVAARGGRAAYDGDGLGVETPALLLAAADVAPL